MRGGRPGRQDTAVLSAHIVSNTLATRRDGDTGRHWSAGDDNSIMAFQSFAVSIVTSECKRAEDFDKRPAGQFCIFYGLL